MKRSCYYKEPCGRKEIIWEPKESISIGSLKGVGPVYFVLPLISGLGYTGIQARDLQGKSDKASYISASTYKNIGHPSNRLPVEVFNSD